MGLATWGLRSLNRGGATIGGFTQTTRVNEPGRTVWLKANIAFK